MKKVSTYSLLYISYATAILWCVDIIHMMATNEDYLFVYFPRLYVLQL